MTYALLLIGVVCFVTYYRIARRQGSTRRAIAVLTAAGFTAATPLLLLVAVVAVTAKFTHLLIKEITA
jgi:heme/copper-type cytochrome/quinol oxidase subunit 1